MTDDLVKRLRGWRGYHQANLSVEAADRIEALQEELRVVKEDRDAYRAGLVGAGFLPERAALKGETP
ncbi:hypothetical protein JZU54_05805 [bacterium]|nr:hypothetical protein [bacterium]